MTKEPTREDLAAAVDACACFQLRRASRAMTQLYDAALQPTGLRSTQFVLLAVLRIEEPVGLTRLAQALGMERSTLARNLIPLEKSDLVERLAGGSRRGNVLRLTRTGRQALADAVPHWAAMQDAFAGGFGEKRWESLCKRLRDAVEASRRI
jgi:DNA-binding MarR family transcriptional regulator